MRRGFIARDSSRGAARGFAKENGGLEAPVSVRRSDLETHLQSHTHLAGRVDTGEVELPDAVHEARVDVVGVVEVVTPQRQLVLRVGRAEVQDRKSVV